MPCISRDAIYRVSICIDAKDTISKDVINRVSTDYRVKTK